jgi:hypothetical protein
MSQGIAQRPCAALHIGTKGFAKKFRENEGQARLGAGCTILAFLRIPEGISPFLRKCADGAALNHEKANVS